MSPLRLTPAQFSALEVNVLDPALDDCELAAAVRPWVRKRTFHMPEMAHRGEVRSALTELANAADAWAEQHADAEVRRGARNDRRAFTRLCQYVAAGD